MSILSVARTPKLKNWKVFLEIEIGCRYSIGKFLRNAIKFDSKLIELLFEMVESSKIDFLCGY